MITGSSAAANDVVQETFVRALSAKIRQYGGTVSSYLGTIVYRLAVKEQQRVQRHVAADDREFTDPASSPLDTILSEERDRVVADAIGALEPAAREVLILRMYGGHSYVEIAEILDCPLGTVKSRIFYAVKTCREKLREKGVLQ